MSDYPDEWPEVSWRVKCEARWRCARCRHPGGINVDDSLAAAHDYEAESVAGAIYCVCFWPGLLRARTLRRDPTDDDSWWIPVPDLPCAFDCRHPDDGKRRQLTVHHLDGDKDNLAWWNLVPLCQVCHLQIQAKVVLDQTYRLPHSPWFRPYVAGYYAERVLGVPLTRTQVESRIPRILRMAQPGVYDGERFDSGSGTR